MQKIATIQKSVRVLLSTSAALFVVTVSWSQRLIWLGTLPNGGWSKAWDVSADGSVVVGTSDSPSGKRAFLWRNRVMLDLGTLPGYEHSEARGVSWDGAVVVGWVEDDYYVDYLAFGWRRETGMYPLTTPGSDSQAWDVSADGSVAVGVVYYSDPYLYNIAVRWLPNGVLEYLGTLGGQECCSAALGVSPDSSVIVGISELNPLPFKSIEAFRWWNGIMEPINPPPDYDANQAESVSANGSVVVGGCWAPWSIQNRSRAFRWENGRSQDLGTLGGPNSWAYDVSADGSTVVGMAESCASPPGCARAFRWTPSRGMEDLNVAYACLLRNDSILYEATAISPDGRYIVGYGYNGTTRRIEAFLLDTQNRPFCLIKPAPLPLP